MTEKKTTIYWDPVLKRWKHKFNIGLTPNIFENKNDFVKMYFKEPH